MFDITGTLQFVENYPLTHDSELFLIIRNLIHSWWVSLSILLTIFAIKIKLIQSDLFTQFTLYVLKVCLRLFLCFDGFYLLIMVYLINIHEISVEVLLDFFFIVEIDDADFENVSDMISIFILTLLNLKFRILHLILQVLRNNAQNLILFNKRTSLLKIKSWIVLNGEALPGQHPLNCLFIKEVLATGACFLTFFLLLLINCKLPCNLIRLNMA